jgi:hypothetical protein
VAEFFSSARRGERPSRRRRLAALLLAWLALGLIVAAQRRLPSFQAGWAFRPDLLACLLIQLAWRLEARGAFLAAAGVSLLAWADSLEPAAMIALRVGALAVAVRAVARQIDVSYWFAQPFAAAPAIVAAEAFVALASKLFFGTAAWAPLSSQLATALAVSLFHWPIERFAREFPSLRL